MTLLLLSFSGNIVIDAGGHVRGGSADGRGQAEGDGADRAPEEAAWNQAWEDEAEHSWGGGEGNYRKQTQQLIFKVPFKAQAIKCGAKACKDLVFWWIRSLNRGQAAQIEEREA